ncbi:MAG: viroplasmin family protein [Deltaproteobacteria bacterium]|jgi:ribonuclease HI|nr:viroplasmin family protein [Deltaproteobacteria bacterium]
MVIQMIENVIVFTDGACSGNPGPGGWASIICYDGKEVLELAGAKKSTTNNQMEMFSVLESLKEVLEKKTGIQKDTRIHIYTDSTYVINGATKWMWGWSRKNWMNSEGKPVANKEIWEQFFFHIKNNRQRINWNYVRGHTGVIGNERCDEIAVSYSRGDEIYLYQGDYEDYPYKIFPLPKVELLPEPKFGNKTKVGDNANGTATVAYYLSFINGVVSRHPTWSECEMKVKGQPGAKYKKIKDPLEEQLTLKGWGCENKK